jgi:hypothetical protein
MRAHRLASLALAARALAATACSAPTEEAGSDGEDLETLESFWADPGKADLHAFGTAYSSNYTNLSVSGFSDAGPFTLFAGTHADDFPWPDAKGWTSVGLQVGGSSYSYATRSQQGLQMTAVAEQGNTLVEVSFIGTMTEQNTNAEVDVRLRLVLSAQAFESWRLGFAGLGMEHRPAAVTFAEGLSNHENSFLTINGAKHSFELDSLFGEVEQGDVLGINYRGSYFKYDYCSVSSPDQGKSFTTFTTRALTEDNYVVEKASDMLQRFGSRAYTLDRYADYSERSTPCVGECETDEQYGRFSNPDNPEGIRCPSYGPEGVLFEHVVDLGTHGAMKRQMFRTPNAEGDEYVGLREIFLPKTNVWGKPCAERYCGELPESE